MSNEEFVNALVSQLNPRFDVPWIGEEVEARALAWCIEKAAPFIPKSLRTVIVSVADGIASAEMDRIEDDFVDLVNRMIDVPFVNEGQEEALIWRPLAQALRRYADAGIAILAV